MASQADQIFAGNATAKVGSIGTFQVVYDYSGAAAAEGIKTLVFATGPLKGLGAMGAPVTDEQQVYLQSMINESQTHFDSAVRSGRGMNATQLAAVRHGGVFPAGEAVEKRLIDGIRSLEKTIEALAAAR
jgi:protease-4